MAGRPGHLGFAPNRPGWPYPTTPDDVHGVEAELRVAVASRAVGLPFYFMKLGTRESVVLDMGFGLGSDHVGISDHDSQRVTDWLGRLRAGLP